MRFIPAPTGAPGGGQYPSFASNSTNQYSPQIFASRMLTTYYETAVALGLMNTNYEGQIKDFGDSVVIRREPEIAVFSHIPGEDISDKYEAPHAPSSLLEINQSLAFAFQIDYIQEKQSDIDINAMYGRIAGTEMGDELDTFLFNSWAGTGAAENRGANAGAITGSVNLGVAGAPRLADKQTVVDILMDLALALDEQKIPRMGRWVVLPPWMHQLLKVSDLGATYITGDPKSPIRNGEVGEVDEFRLHKTTKLPYDPVTGEQTIFAGTNDAMTFAGQILPHMMETFPNPNKFGKLGRGMNVFGSGTLEGKALVEAVVKRA